MKKMTIRGLLAALLLGLLPAGTNAQVFDAAGTRAAGMGGAFVGVADDASAFYWNPAGLAAGAIFSLVMDTGRGESVPEGSFAGGERSSFLLALSTPALGLGYYRLEAVKGQMPLLPDPLAGESGITVAPQVQIDSLITHHAGLTLVQSITQGVAVGTTLKLVRGVAGTRTVSASGVEEALEGFGGELLTRSSNRFDLDVGLIAYGGPLKLGLTLRNVTEPEFEVAGGGRELVLERQARAGISYALNDRWLAAADADLVRSRDAFGERRDIAVGIEGRLQPRLFVRSGLSLNTLEEDDRLEDSRAAAFSAGASYAVRQAFFLDGHFTTGDTRAGFQWGLAVRFAY